MIGAREPERKRSERRIELPLTDRREPLATLSRLAQLDHGTTLKEHLISVVVCWFAKCCGRWADTNAGLVHAGSAACFRTRVSAR